MENNMPVSGMYLQLFHGRKSPEEVLDDWGEQGPIFGPLQFAHQTYLTDIKINYHRSAHIDADLWLSFVDDLVYYDGMYYGDWSVFMWEGQDADNVNHRLKKFDQEKAKLPKETENGRDSDR